MNQKSASWKIATIRGIELRLHVSILFLMLYIVTLLSVQFNGIVSLVGLNPEDLRLGPVVWASLFALSLFLSIAFHELGHAFTAQSVGLKVRSITLMMLGGVSEIDLKPEKRLSEFKLSIVGPLVSFAIGAVLLFWSSRVSQPDLMFFTYWLGSANVTLGVFNLLPAFPLDGGRALRSLLAARIGLVRATQASVRVSKVLAWVLGIVGLLGYNLLLMLIAFFIYMMAEKELFLLLSKEVLKGVIAAEIGVREEPIDEMATLTATASRMRDLKTSVLPVRTASKGANVISALALKQVPRRLWGITLVKQVMTSVPKAVDVHEPVPDILPALSASPVGALPVTEGGEVVGLLRSSDVAEIFQVRSLEELEPEKKRAA